MKIVIVGPGAMGCLSAVLLQRAKQELWILDKRKDRAEKIAKQGISAQGLSGNLQADVKITASPQDIGTADLVIISVKSYDTKEAIKHALPLIGKATTILTLQNGIGNLETIGVTNQGATLIDIGSVRHAGRGETIIGGLDGKITPELRSLREVFNKSGIETKISRDIKGLLWSKLIINAGINALSAITRLANGKLIEFEWTRRILREAAAEATKVAKRKRIKLIYDDPLAKVEAVCEATAANISSMLQDVFKKKRTEIDFINGVIVRQGQELGIATPVNSLLTDLVKTIEASYDLKVD
jgi:2-dehydropantoate 2-reductase